VDKKLIGQLIKSLDDGLNQEEVDELNSTLATSNPAKEELEWLQDIRQSIQSVKTESFRPYFAQRVMRRIAKLQEIKHESDLFQSLMVVFRPVAISASFIIAVILIYNISTGNFTSLESILGIPEYNLENITYAAY